MAIYESCLKGIFVSIVLNDMTIGYHWDNQILKSRYKRKIMAMLTYYAYFIIFTSMILRTIDVPMGSPPKSAS